MNSDHSTSDCVVCVSAVGASALLGGASEAPAISHAEAIRFTVEEVESCIRLEAAKRAKLQRRHDALEHFIRTWCLGTQGCAVDGTVLHEAARKALQ